MPKKPKQSTPTPKQMEHLKTIHGAGGMNYGNAILLIGNDPFALRNLVQAGFIERRYVLTPKGKKYLEDEAKDGKEE